MKQEFTNEIRKLSDLIKHLLLKYEDYDNNQEIDNRLMIIRDELETIRGEIVEGKK